MPMGVVQGGEVLFAGFLFEFLVEAFEGPPRPRSK
jgi:hypothetical protein